MEIKFNQRSRQGRQGAGSSIAGVLFGLFFGGIGGLFFYLILVEGLEILEQYSWTSATCVVQSSSIDVNRSNDDPFNLKVRFSSGGSGATDTLRKSYDDYSDALRKKHLYEPGSEHDCYVNPRQRGEMALERGSPFFILLLLFPSIFIFIGGYVAYFSIVGGGGEEEERRKKKEREVSTVLVILGSIVCASIIRSPLRK